MPVYLLHQNMRNFGGAVAHRNNAFNGPAAVPPALPRPATWPAPPAPAPANGFAPIAALLAPGGGAVWVAGLTEVRNSATAAFAVLPLFTSIFGGVAPTTYAVIKSYSSALADTEYVAIAVRGATVLAVGRIMFVKAYHVVYSEWPVPAPPPLRLIPGWANTLPDNAAADYRGIVYLKLRIPGAAPGVSDIAVGFTHNTYTLNTREIVMQSLSYAVNAMKTRGIPVNRVYLGGDFNVAPPAGRIGRGARQIWPYSAPVAVPTIFAGAVPWGTTFSGNMYDYWFADIDPAVGAPPLLPGGVVVPAASAYSNTMDYNPVTGVGWMSDHAAIVLRII